MRPVDGSSPGVTGTAPEGSVIIPAHNEAAVIGRALAPLAEMAAAGDLEVIVACNGCDDDTATVANRFVGVKVLELPQPSKVAALNAADAAARHWPRLYLDADVEIEPLAVRHVLATLRSGPLMAARPAFRYETADASPVVRAFYRARSRLPSIGLALWGAGAFAISEQGHRRFGAFPVISPRFSGDDLFVDHQFDVVEKRVVDTPPVVVRTPRHASALVGTLRRNYRTQFELRDHSTTSTTARELLSSVRGRREAVDAFIYAGFVTIARLRMPWSGRRAVWERDDTSRSRPCTP